MQANAQTNFARLKLEQIKHASNITIRGTDTDNSGNLYVTGFFSGTVSFPTTPITTLLMANGTDIFVLKIDNSGNFEWAFSFGGGSDDRANAIKVDRTNNRLIVAGYFQGIGVTVSVSSTPVISSTVGGGADAFFVVYDLTKNYNDIGFAMLTKVIRGVNFQTIYALEIDDSNNVYVGGFFQERCKFSPSDSLTVTGSEYEGWLAKYSISILPTSISFQWAARIGATSSNDNVYNIAVSGLFCYVVGYATNGANINGSFNFTASSGGSAFLARLSVDTGTAADFVNIASGGSGSDALKIQLRGNNAFIAGTFGSTADFNPTPATTDLTSAGGRDVYVAKYDVSSAPNLSWVAGVGSASNSDWDEIGNITLQGDDVVLACSHSGSATYSRKSGANLGSNISIPGNNFDGTLLKISGENGNLLWYHSISGAGVDKLSSIALFNDGSDWYLWGVGSFQDNIDFDFEPNVSNIVAGSLGATFYAKYRFKLPQSINVASLVANTLPDGRIQLSAQTNVGLPDVKFFSTNTQLAQIDNANILTVFPIFEEEEALIQAYHLGDILHLPTDTLTVMKVSSYSLVSSLQEGWENELNVFPNPTSDYFVLQNKNSAILVEGIEIFDTFGKKVASAAQSTTYQTKHLGKGIYYVHIRTNQGVVRRKIVKN
ncbi:MAG: hypothetical protein OHK0045_15750 [Raineya sp.]